jgi:hypothetical protein
MYHVNALRFIGERYDPLSDVLNARRAVLDVAERLQQRYQLALDVDRVLQRFALVPVPSCCALYDVIMSELWLRSGRTHWAEKCQLLWREIGEFVRDMPNGRAILVLRDPRSTLASFKNYTYAPPPAYLGAIFNCLDALRHAKAYRDNLPSDRFLLVRYEDAARDPQGVADRMFRFLELDPSLASHDRTCWRNETGERWQDNTAFRGTFDVDQAIERWRDWLSPMERALTECVCGPFMTDFGYAPDGRPLDWPEALRLCLTDPKITEYLRRWLVDGEGIEAFPTDPLMSENWQENQQPAALLALASSSH